MADGVARLAFGCLVALGIAVGCVWVCSGVCHGIVFLVVVECFAWVDDVGVAGSVSVDG